MRLRREKKKKERIELCIYMDTCILFLYVYIKVCMYNTAWPTLRDPSWLLSARGSARARGVSRGRSLTFCFTCDVRWTRHGSAASNLNVLQVYQLSWNCCLDDTTLYIEITYFLPQKNIHKKQNGKKKRVRVYLFWF